MIIRRKLFFLFSTAILTVILLLVGYSQSVSAQEDLVKRGEYLTTLCIGCHTPPKAEFAIPDLSKLTPDQLVAISMSNMDTLDMTKKFAGGRPLPLPGGLVVFSKNLTPDKETGIGDYTDGDIESAIRFGVRKDGTRLHPIMPYRNFNNLSKEDVASIIAFLRTLPAISNAVPPRDTSADNFPPVEAQPGGAPEKAPLPSDKAAYGAYIVNAWLSCGDCHTPFDQKTGAPIIDLFMAGGQPFEGPWGIVYGGNITPHNETGIGAWTDDEIKRAIVAGIGKDNRRLIVMPWQDYAPLTPQDLDAVVFHLRNNLKPVENKVPPASISPAFQKSVDPADIPTLVAGTGAASGSGNAASNTAAPNNTSTMLIIVGVIVAVFILGGVLVGMRRSNTSS